MHSSHECARPDGREGMAHRLRPPYVSRLTKRVHVQPPLPFGTCVPGHDYNVCEEPPTFPTFAPTWKPGVCS